MPHDIAYTANGEAMMMFYGDKPWHGLGTEVSTLVTAPEAVRLAQCDYTVEAQQMMRQDSSGQAIEYPNRFALVRSDTNEALDIVSDRYEILQNIDTAQFADEVFAQGNAVIETCGALRGGRQFWMLARTPDTFEPVKGDPISRYILFSSSHDRSQALEVATTDIRAVCSNTVRFAMDNAQYRVQIRHTASIHDRAVQTRRALRLGDAYHHLMMEGIDRLVRTPMRASEMDSYGAAFLNLDPTVAATDRHQYSQDALGRLRELFEAGRGQDIPGVSGTAYAALNATTEYLDYYRRVSLPNQGSSEDLQGTLSAQDARLHNSRFGRGQGQRDRGWNLLQQFSKVGPSAFQGAYIPRVRITSRANRMEVL